MKKPKEKSLWKNQTYIQVFSAYSILMFGVFVDMLAIMTIVSFEWKEDPTMIGLIPVSYALPGILFGSWAGVFADRFRKIPIMIFCNIMIAVLTIVLLSVQNMHELLLVLMIRSTFGVFFYPAQQTLTRHIVSANHLTKAVSMNGIVEQAAKIIGPLVGGMLLSLFQPEVCLVIRAVSCLLAAFILLPMIQLVEDQPRQNSVKGKQSSWAEWLHGWGYVLSNRKVLVTMIFVCISMALLQLVDSQFPTLFKSLFPNNKSMMGYVLSIVGIGGVLSALFIQRLKHFQYGWVIGGGTALMGIGFGGIGLITASTPFIFCYLIGFIAGIGSGLMLVSNQVILQKEVNQEQIGRVFGIKSSLTNAILIISPSMSGPLVHLVGVTRLYFYVGTGLLMVGFIGILFQKKFWGAQVPIQKEGREVYIP